MTQKQSCVYVLIFVLTALFTGLFASKSEAVNFIIDTKIPRYAIPTDDLINNPSSVVQIGMCMAPNPAIYGVSVGTIYCVKKFLSYAVHQYTGYFSSSNLVKSIQFSCYMIALAFLGLRFMTLQSDFIIKDVALFLIKVVISVYLITHSAALYDAFVAMIGESIGWVSGLFPTEEPDACLIMKAPKIFLTAVDGSVNYDEYNAWHMADCVLLRVFGIAFPMPFSTVAGVNVLSLVPASVLAAFPKITTFDISMTDASMIFIVALSLATGTAGKIVLIVASFFIFTLIKLLARAIFYVLTSYIVLAGLTILIPLFAPLLVFSSHTNDSYTRQIFDRFVNMIFSCLLHPVCLVAYVGFMVICVDSLIEGDTSSTPAIKAIYAKCHKGALPDAPVAGAPYEMNLCSYQQLFPTLTQLVTQLAEKAVGAPPTTSQLLAMTSNYNYLTNYGQTLFTWKQAADPQTASADCKVIDTKKTFILQPLVSQANQLAAKSVGIEFPAPNSLKVTYLILYQFQLLLIIAVIMIVVLLQILEQLPKFLDYIVGTRMSSIFAFGSPLDGLLDRARSGALAGVASAKTPESLMAAVKAVPGKAMKGLEGGAKGIFNSLIGRR